MGMSAGGGGGASANINVTPLIDVLLVLLIIFMVIQPNVVRGLDTLVPQPPKDKTNAEPDQRTIVVQVQGTPGNPQYLINETPFNKQDLEPKLQAIFETRNDKIMFVKGSPDMDYGKIVEVIDFGHQAGVDNIGIITPRVEQGQ